MKQNYKSINEAKNAVKDLTQKIAIDLKSPLLYADRGNAYQMLGETDDAIKDYSKAIDFEPDNASFYALRAVCHEENGDPFEALEDYIKAIELDPNNAEYHYSSAEICYYHLQDTDEALEDYNKAIRCDPSRADCHYSKGYIYDVHFKDYKKALESYSKAVELEPSNADYCAARATILKVYEALEDCNKSIKLEPNNAKYYAERAAIYNYKLEDYNKALEDYNKLIELEPNNAEHYAARAAIYDYDLKDYGKALEDYYKLIELEPNNAEHYAARAAIYDYDLKDYGKALDDYHKLIELEPNNAKFYVARAGIYNYHLEDYGKALEDCAKAIELEPNNAGYYADRAFLFRYRLNKYSKARTDYSKAIELDPNNAQYYIARGIVNHELHQSGDALEDFNNAIKIDKKSIKEVLSALKVTILPHYIFLDEFYKNETEEIIGKMFDFLPKEHHSELFNKVAYTYLRQEKERKLDNLIEELKIFDTEDKRNIIIHSIKDCAEDDSDDLVIAYLFNREEFSIKEKIKAGLNYISAKLMQKDSFDDFIRTTYLLNEIKSLIGKSINSQIDINCIDYIIALLENKDYDIANLFSEESKKEVVDDYVKLNSKMLSIRKYNNMLDRSVNQLADIQDVLSQLFWSAQEENREYLPYIYQVLNSYLFYRSKQKEKELMASKATEGTIAVLAHSIKNPAFVMKSQADILSKEINSSDLKDKKIGRMIKKTVSERFKMMEQSSAEIVDIVNVLRTIQKVDIDNEIELNLKHLADECNDSIGIMLNEYMGDEYLYKQAKGKKIKFINDLPEVIKLKGEESAIKILMKDLILNALLHAEDGSELVLSFAESNNKYILKVKNRGGDLPEELKDVFIGKNPTDLSMIKTKKHLGSRIIKILSDKMKWKTDFVHANGINEFIFEINKAGE